MILAISKPRDKAHQLAFRVGRPVAMSEVAFVCTGF